ncbi:peptidase M4 family protein [Tumebacillus sp. ITR2]|uniref:Neutral metalloproteinase n=1 Tax=Tumebacillus amylolyticus TaxID=2801339 RepID=A0ABS1J573_9BACL|nr:M4 family metallopeptidase [Tumebacillus amylolyticus]MBL0385340.1 peptidase M4 family protein [Tumebacillus amylolyticus]
MKRSTYSIFVMSSLLTSVLVNSASAQINTVQTLRDEAGKVHNVVGTLGKVSGSTAAQRALQALDLVGPKFGFTRAAGHFHVTESHTDENGVAHTKVDQTLNGIPVFDHQMIVHEMSGTVKGVTGDFDNLTPNTDTPVLTEEQAIEKALNSLDFHGTLTRTATSELNYVAQGSNAVLTYKVNLAYNDAQNPGNWLIFVNALDGSIVRSINELENLTVANGTGTGVLGDTKTLHTTNYSGTYYLEDHTKTMTGDIETFTYSNGTSTGYYMTDSDNIWDASPQRAAVDAHYFAGVVWDYYKGLGRNSFDNAGGPIYSNVHYSTNYNGAFWNGMEMMYGDGDGINYLPLSGARDIVAHELTHAVTQFTCNLTYSNQSGALSESWSDAQASVVDGDDWEIGEDVFTPSTAGDALRSLAIPTLYGQPDSMLNFVNTLTDNGGVHANSGIPNKAFYNFATAIGSRTIAGKVWYVASRDYMTSSTNFSGARAATLQAVSALYGPTSIYATSLQTAWTTVGVN